MRINYRAFGYLWVVLAIVNGIGGLSAMLNGEEWGDTTLIAVLEALLARFSFKLDRYE